MCHNRIRNIKHAFISAHFHVFGHAAFAIPFLSFIPGPHIWLTVFKHLPDVLLPAK